MDKTNLHILLIEDNPADVLFLREALAQDAQVDFRLTIADSLGEALALLAEQPFDAALLDLGLPDSQGLSTFVDLHRAAPDLPVVVLSALDDEEVAMQSMQAGAQDYLVKRLREFPVAGRALRYAVERQKTRSALQASERRFSILFHSNPIPAGLTRASDYRIVDINAAWQDLTGYTRAEALGKTASELGLARADTLQRVREILGTQDELNRFELRLYTRAGNERTVLVSSEQVELDGQVYYLNTLLDITERKQAENALEQTRNTLAEAQKIAHMGSFEYIAATQTTVWSEEEFRIYGLDPAGQSPAYDEMLHKAIHPDDAALLNDVFTKALQQGTVYELEHRVVRPDGSVRWVHDRAQPYYDEHGEIERYVGITLDITERKHAEEAQVKADALLHTVLNNAPITIFAIDREGRFTLSEGKGLERVGLKPGENVGVAVLDLYESLPYVEHNGNRTNGKAILQRALAGETIGAVNELRGVHFDNYFAPVYDAERQVAGVVGVATDITERRQAEMELRASDARFSNMFHNSPAGIILTRLADGYILDVNDAYASMLGYTRDEMIGRTTLELGLWKAPEARASVNQTLESDGRVRGLEVDLLTRNGEQRSVIAAAEWLELSGEMCILSSVMDNTERKRAETLLNQRLEDLALINKLNDAVNHGEGLDQVAELLASETKRIFKSQYASVYLIHPETQALVLEQFTMPQELIARLEKLLGMQVPQVHIPLDGDDHFNEVLKSDQGLLITGDEAVQHWLTDFTNTGFLPAQVHPRIRKFIPAAVKLLNVKSVISIPLRAGNETLGLIEFVTEELFDEGALERLRNVRHQLAEVIVRKRAEQALRASNEQYRLLSEELEERVRQRTAEVQDLYDNAPAGYHSLDQDGIFTRINQTELNWLGYTRAEVLGRPFTEFISAPSREVFAENFPILKRDGQIHNIEIVMVRKDGTSYPALVNATAIYDADGNFVQSRSTVFDNTERKQAEQAIREREAQLRLSRDKLSASNAALEKASLMKDEFLANMSHELRTPLTGILGMSELLQLTVYGPLTEKQETAVQNIERSGRHLLELINDILDLSKIEAGMLELNIKPVALNDICQASLQLTRGMANKRQQTICFSMEPPAIRVRADALRLKQMLVNLLSNAIKFTAENGSLGLEVRGDETTQVVRLTVWDKGIGIAPEDLEQLFQPFVQLESNLSRQYEGTGLGLSLVHQMAELHGGSVEVKSAPGEGSRFTIVLPWQPEDSRPAPVAHKSSVSLQRALVIEGGETGAAPQPHSSQPLVLIVDDNEMVAETLSVLLESKNFRVAAAHSAAESLEIASQLRPDIILMDIQMPGMDGIEATRRLRAHPDPRVSQAPIVALTALAMSGDRERCLAAGANAYLSKPVDLKQLVKLVGELASANAHSP